METPLARFQDLVDVGGDESFRKVITDDSFSFTKPTICEEETAVIFYTSGTNGKPKGVMLSAGNVQAIAAIWAESLEVTSSDRMHIVTPLFHCAASHCFSIPTILWGGTVVIEKAFSPEKSLETMGREQVTIFFGVPAIYSILLRYLRK